MNPLPEDIVSDLTEHEAIRTYLVHDCTVFCTTIHYMNTPQQEAKDAFNVWFQYFHHKKPVSI